MRYKVDSKERGSHHVIGLPSCENEYPDTLLIYMYEAGDIDTHMKTPKMMLGALYDLFQTHDDLHEGDVFETEFGDYVCQGVHVVPVIEKD